MKLFIRLVYLKIIIVLRCISWQKDVYFLRKVIKKIENIEEIKNGNFLILLPHADDEWVGCSRLICQEKNEVILLNMDMEGGDTPSLHELRRKELEKLSSMFKRDLILIDEDKINSLKKCILKLKPQYICLPYYFDWHPEHIEVMSILKEALIQTSYDCNILMYQVSLPILYSECNSWIGMNKRQWKEKWKIFEEIYSSQTKIPYMRFAYNERINGAIVSQYASEVYHVTSSANWSENLSVYILSNGERNEIKHVLNNIGLTRDTLHVLLESRKKMINN